MAGRTDVRVPKGGVPGWGDAKERVSRPRMIVSSRGEDKDGKTQFGFTAPDPIACFPFDNNTDELIQKWLKRGKRILTPNESLDYSDATKKEDWAPIWARFEEYWEDALNSESIRTIMADTFTEANELSRLAEFGKLSQVVSRDYGKINAKFKRLIDMTYKTDKNIILIHRLKDEYKNDARTGTRILAGFGSIRYKVQINLLHKRDIEYRDLEKGVEGFYIEVENCTQNESLANTVLMEPDNTWTGLGCLVYPDTAVWDWE